jgi:outer membrane protein insertion porin family
MKQTKILLILFVVLSAISQPTSAQIGLGKKKEGGASLGARGDGYTIGGMRISGTTYFDNDLLYSISGLNIGDPIKIEGDEKITKAIQNLWKQNFFSNIKIKVDKIIDDKVFLEIELTERPRLSKFNFKGIRQTEANDLKEKLPLVKGKVITEAMRVNTVDVVKKFYYGKGFLNATCKILERPDTSGLNTLIFTLLIDKGYKSKINQVNITGNENANYLKLKGMMKGSKEMARLSFKPIEYNSVYGNSQPSFKEYIKNGGFLSPSKTISVIDPYIRYNFITPSKFDAKKFDEDKIKLIDYYNSLGFRDAAVENDTIYKNEDGYLNIDLKVNEGRRYYFGDINWKGNTKYSDSILNLILGIKKGDLFNAELLDKRLGRIPGGEGAEDITTLYMDDGYLFFTVEPLEVSINSDSINYEIRINEGNQAIIRNIIISGNDKTKEHVIRRELRTLPGNKFSRTDLIRSQREISSLGFFDAEKIGIVPKPQADGTVDIEYTVVEKSNDQLEAQAGFGGALGITGTLGISFNNFSVNNLFNKRAYDPLPMGDGQKISIRGQANGRWFNSFNFSFSEPWMGGKKPTSLQMGLYRSYFSSNYGTKKEYDTSYMTTWGANLGIMKRVKWPDDNFTLALSLNYQLYDLEKQNFGGGTAPFRTGQANNAFLRVSLGRYTIDQPLYPRKGSNINLTASITPPYSLLSNKDYNRLEPEEKYKWIEYYKFRFTAEWYQKLKGNLVLKLAAKHGYVGNYTKGIMTPFERFQLGGNGLVGFQLFGRDIIAQRGYDVYAPRQNSNDPAAIIFNKYTAEVRYPFSLNPSSTIYGLAFADAANAWTSYKQFNPFKLNRDAGVGVRIFLPMFGMIGVDYGMRFDSTGFGTNSLTPGKPFRNTTVTFMLGQEPD